MDSESQRMAVLIDGENAQASLADQIISEVARHGIVKIRRVYGNWMTPNMSGWKGIVQSLSIQPVQRFPNAVGKNATDIALVIDAMDILHAGSVNGFCVVSSDSDYTGLATRIREAGHFMIGVGRKDTPQSFVNACDEFLYTETLNQLSGMTQKPATGSPAVQTHKKANSSTAFTQTLRRAIAKSVQSDGWALIADVGSNAREIDPKFGHQGKLSAQIKKYPNLFEVRDNEYVRARPQSVQQHAPSVSLPTVLMKTIQKAIQKSVRQDGWAHLADVGSNARIIDSNFSSNYSGKLSNLIKTRPDLFEIKGNEYIRVKP